MRDFEIGTAYLAVSKIDRWWNPFRTRAWRNMRELQKFFDEVIKNKRESIRSGAVEQSKREKDLLTLMLEAAEKDPDDKVQFYFDLIDWLLVFKWEFDRRRITGMFLRLFLFLYYCT